MCFWRFFCAFVQKVFSIPVLTFNKKLTELLVFIAIQTDKIVISCSALDLVSDLVEDIIQDGNMYNKKSHRQLLQVKHLLLREFSCSIEE
jgi:hypothetical protein